MCYNKADFKVYLYTTVIISMTKISTVFRHACGALIKQGASLPFIVAGIRY